MARTPCLWQRHFKSYQNSRPGLKPRQKSGYHLQAAAFSARAQACTLPARGREGRINLRAGAASFAPLPPAGRPAAMVAAMAKADPGHRIPGRVRGIREGWVARDAKPTGACVAVSAPSIPGVVVLTIWDCIYY